MTCLGDRRGDRAAEAVELVLDDDRDRDPGASAGANAMNHAV